MIPVDLPEQGIACMPENCEQLSVSDVYRGKILLCVCGGLYL